MIMGILNQCSQKGISIHTIKDNFDLSDNINSKIIAFAFALAAEIERNLISQRTKEALAVKRMEGGYSMSSIAKRYGIHRNTLRKYRSEILLSRKSLV